MSDSILSSKALRGADLTGKRYGKLVVVSRFNRKGSDNCYLWLCKCDCGKEVEVTVNRLRMGQTKSCGCSRFDSPEKYGKANKTHGMKGTPEYRSWRGMKTRCLDVNNEHFAGYGERGITIFQEWKDSFEAFFAYMGLKPSPKHSVERIDVNGNYEPGNVKWGTTEEQNNNRRDNRFVTAFGETMTVGRWAKRFGLPRHLIYSRLSRGWTAEAALTVPTGTKNRWTSKEHRSTK